MQDIQLLLEQYGGWLVFANVLVEQAGLPVPAYPMLIAAGALAGAGGWLVPWLAATAACLLADSLWYAAGQRYGSRLLGVICKMSLSQDSCIRQTQRLYLRIGVRALLVCKFLPGAGALSTVMAGLTGTPYRRFLGYDLVGSLIWSGSALLLGGLFHNVVNDFLEILGTYGAMGLGVLAAVLALYILARFLRRRILLRSLRVIPRLSVDELMQWRQDGRHALVFDVRPEALREEQRIPGAIAVDLKAPLPALDAQALESDIVVYCACPNEVSAALLASRLRAAGYPKTWALRGGYQAWQEHEHPSPPQGA
ncbi:DedA family protein/thiosulfate sulfurtransferase GlpE [Achromobacter aegrifaciens]